MRSIAYAMTNLNEFNFWNTKKKHHHAYNTTHARISDTDSMF